MEESSVRSKSSNQNLGSQAVQRMLDRQLRSDAKKNSCVQDDYSALAVHKSSPKTGLKNCMAITDSFTVSAVGALKSQLIEKKKSQIAGNAGSGDYLLPSFSQHKAKLNMPSRNELQSKLGQMNTGIIQGQKPLEGIQNF